MVTKEEYEQLQKIAKEGGDPASVLSKYMGSDEKVEGWKKAAPPPQPMKVVKTMVRTKSGRLVSWFVAWLTNSIFLFQGKDSQ